jgi:hypothetical protein
MAKVVAPAPSYSKTMDPIFESLKESILDVEASKQRMGHPGSSSHVQKIFDLIENMQSKLREYEEEDEFTEQADKLQAPALRPYEPHMWQIDHEMYLSEKQREKKDGIDISSVHLMQYADVKPAWIQRNIWVPRWSDLPGKVWLHGMYEVVPGPAGPFKDWTTDQAGRTQAAASRSRS